MPAGLIVRNANNQIILDTTMRITRVLGVVYNITSGGATVTNVGFSTGTPFFYPVFLRWSNAQQENQWSGVPVTCPVVTFNGNTMTISPAMEPQYYRGEVYNVVYGVY